MILNWFSFFRERQYKYIEMGNIYTVGPNEALVVSGMYIITLFSFCEVKLQLIYKVFWIPLHSKSRLAFSRCQLSASYFFV